MSDIGKSERATQNRVIALFLDELRYRLLGDWSDRVNRQIDEGLLRDWLANRGHTPEQIGRTLDLLGREANNPTRSLYDNNRAVYSLLRYGVDVRVAAGENTEKVWLIDWQNPEANDFAVAAEVTLIGAHERRPDLVLYVNGLAVGVIELKRSAVSIGDGIRQNSSRISNRSSTPGSSARFSSFLPATTPRVCGTAPSARRKSSSSSLEGG